MNLNRHQPNRQTGFFWNWYVFHDPFTFAAFWTYFTCATAQCKRAPFDLAEAESELVAGFHTEYSGLRWSFFFMAEYGSHVRRQRHRHAAVPGRLEHRAVAVRPERRHVRRTAATGAVVLGNVINVVVFIVKGWLLVFVMMWVRWTLPRLRIDQVMMTCLKYLLPISCVLLLGVSLWQVAMPIVVSARISNMCWAACCVAGRAGWRGSWRPRRASCRPAACRRCGRRAIVESPRRTTLAASRTGPHGDRPLQRRPGSSSRYIEWMTDEPRPPSCSTSSPR